MMRVPGDDGRYRLRGSDLIGYANGSGEHRYSLRGPIGADATPLVRRVDARDLSTPRFGTFVLRAINLFFGLRGSGTVRYVLTGGLRSTASLLSPGWSTLREAANLSLSPGGIATLAVLRCDWL